MLNSYLQILQIHLKQVYIVQLLAMICYEC